MPTFDFEDGNGAVPAHQHANGGGWVADTAVVDDTCYIGPDALVYGLATVANHAWVREMARVYGSAHLDDDCLVEGEALIYGSARIRQSARVWGQAKVCGTAHIAGTVWVRGSAAIAEGEFTNDEEFE